MGVTLEPVEASGAAPACIERVSKPVKVGRSPITVGAGESLGRPMGRFLEEITPESKPCCPSSRNRREYSIFGQRSITTLSPAAVARSAAASLRTPSCIHTTDTLRELFK